MLKSNSLINKRHGKDKSLLLKSSCVQLYFSFPPTSHLLKHHLRKTQETLGVIKYVNECDIVNPEEQKEIYLHEFTQRLRKRAFKPGMESKVKEKEGIGVVDNE